MTEINSYFIDQNKDKIYILLELKDKSEKNLSTFYYQLVLKEKEAKNKKKYYEIDSLEEIFNIFQFLYSKFGLVDIKKRKLDSTTNDYIVKMLNFQSYKKGFNERLTNRLLAYYDNYIHNGGNVERTLEH